MRRAALTFGLALAILLGAASGEYLSRQFWFRRWIGELVRRGELMGLVNRHGIYDHDVERAWRATLFANGAEPPDVEEPTARQEKRTIFARLIEEEKLNAAAAQQPIDESAITRELDLLRWQLGDEKKWTALLRDASVSSRTLRCEVAANLRGRAWLEARITAALAPNENDCRRYYEAHRAAFRRPTRFRATHLFLAAPDGYPGAVIEAKRALINTLSTRLRNGGSFEALVAEFSEDEATKKRGGDLNYFTEARMLPEIFRAAQQLRVGETSAPIRSRLGFHLLRLTQALPAEEMTFAEALPEIVATRENERRSQAVNALIATLPGKMKIAGARNQFEFEPADSPNETAISNGTH